MGEETSAGVPTRRRYRTAWVAVGLTIQLMAILYIGLASGPHADEVHYHATILRFVDDPSLRTLIAYNEVAAPLTFILYGGWGRIFGTDLATLRLLSVLSAFTLQVLVYILLERGTRSSRRAFWLGCVFLLNPYMIGLNVVVYTDVMAMIGLVVLALGVVRGNAWLLLAGSAWGLLSRQYMIFSTIAAGLYYLIVWMRGRERRHFNALLALTASTLPLAALMLLWGGSAPPNGVAHWLQGETQAWRPAYLVAYVTLLPIYILPVVLWRWRTLAGERSLWLWSLLLAPLYAVAPIEASAITRRLTDYETVGLAHRGIVMLTGDAWSAQGILFAAWVVGVPIVLWVIRDAWRHRHSTSVVLFLDLAIVVFLAVMPLSFHVWEKYLLPILPIVLCRFGLEAIDDRN